MAIPTPRKNLTPLIIAAPIVILLAAVISLTLIPRLQQGDRSTQQQKTFTAVAARLTTLVDAKPVANHDLTYRTPATNVDGGGTRIDRILVYPVNWQTELLPIVTALTNKNYSCTSNITTAGTQRNGDPLGNYNYATTDKTPDPFDPATIGRCNDNNDDPGIHVDYSFYNTAYEGETATVVRLSTHTR